MPSLRCAKPSRCIGYQKMFLSCKAAPWARRTRRLARGGAARLVHTLRTDHFEQIMKATGGRGVEVIVELLANVNLGKDLTILAKRGRVAIIGSRGPREIDTRATKS